MNDRRAIVETVAGFHYQRYQRYLPCAYELTVQSAASDYYCRSIGRYETKQNLDSPISIACSCLSKRIKRKRDSLIILAADWIVKVHSQFFPLPRRSVINDM